MRTPGMGIGQAHRNETWLRRAAALGVGVGSALLYGLFALWVPLLPRNLYVPLLDLGKITGYTWPSALTFAFLVASLFVLYATGFRLARQGALGIRTVLTFGGIFSCALVLAYPANAVDVFGYIAQGRLVTLHGLNPFSVSPSAGPTDPILPYLAFPGEPSQYGPLWVALSALVTFLVGPDLLKEVLAYKLIAAACLLGAAWLAYRASLWQAPGQRGRAVAGACVLAWNPLLQWELAGNAHNDAVMALFVVLAILLLARRSLTAVIPMLVVAALIKVPAAFLIPFVGLAILRHDRWAAIEGVALGAIVAAVAYRPFWFGPGTLTALGRGDLFTASLATILRDAMQPLLDQAAAEGLARNVCLGLLAFVCIPLLWWAFQAHTPIDALYPAYRAMLAFTLLGVGWFQAWYVLWPAAVAAALPLVGPRRDVILLSLGAMGSYLVFIYFWVMGVIPGGTPWVQVAAYLTIIGPLVFGWLTSAGRPRWGRRPITAVAH